MSIDFVILIFGLFGLSFCITSLAYGNWSFASIPSSSDGVSFVSTYDFGLLETSWSIYDTASDSMQQLSLIASGTVQNCGSESETAGLAGTFCPAGALALAFSIVGLVAGFVTLIRITFSLVNRSRFGTGIILVLTMNIIAALLVSIAGITYIVLIKTFPDYGSQLNVGVGLGCCFSGTLTDNKQRMARGA